jgi:hypothetical protein
MMKTKIILIGSILLLSLVATACGGQAGAAGPETETQGEQSLDDLNSLREALLAAGASVETGEQIDQPFFSVPGQILKVNGVDVQVFEYETSEAMGTEASQVSEDGSTIGTSMVSWMEASHFFRAGRMVVLYVGEDQGLLDLLEGVLGPQFAGR